MSRELLKASLMVINELCSDRYRSEYHNIVKAIKDELAKPEQKPVAWTLLGANGEIDELYCTMFYDEAKDWLNTTIPGCSIVPMYLSTVSVKPLIDENILQIVEGGEALDQFTLIDFARAIEKAHGIE